MADACTLLYFFGASRNVPRRSCFHCMGQEIEGPRHHRALKLPARATSTSHGVDGCRQPRPCALDAHRYTAGDLREGRAYASASTIRRLMKLAPQCPRGRAVRRDPWAKARSWPSIFSQARQHGSERWLITTPARLGCCSATASTACAMCELLRGSLPLRDSRTPLDRGRRRQARRRCSRSTDSYLSCLWLAIR